MSGPWKRFIAPSSPFLHIIIIIIIIIHPFSFLQQHRVPEKLHHMLQIPGILHLHGVYHIYTTTTIIIIIINNHQANKASKGKKKGVEG